MARVNVLMPKNLRNVNVGCIARACRGEFFGMYDADTAQFGFASRKHARLFVNRLRRANVLARSF